MPYGGFFWSVLKFFGTAFSLYFHCIKKQTNIFLKTLCPTEYVKPQRTGVTQGGLNYETLCVCVRYFFSPNKRIKNT